MERKHILSNTQTNWVWGNKLRGSRRILGAVLKCRNNWRRAVNDCVIIVQYTRCMYSTLVSQWVGFKVGDILNCLYLSKILLIQTVFTDFMPQDFIFHEKHVLCQWRTLTGVKYCELSNYQNIVWKFIQLLPNAFKKTYDYRSNNFSINHLPELV